jgi:hypothetical protein
MYTLSRGATGIPKVHFGLYPTLKMRLDAENIDIPWNCDSLYLSKLINVEFLVEFYHAFGPG